MDLRTVLAEAFDHRGSVTSRQLQHALGISRQAVWLQIRHLIESGEVAFEGAGRGVRYVPGPGAARAGGVVRGAQVTDKWTPTFWAELVRESSRVAYLCVRHASRGTQRREHGLALVADLRHQSLIILDFEGVDQVSDTFAKAFLAPEHNFRVLPINACPRVRRAFDRAMRNQTLRPISDADYGT